MYIMMICALTMCKYLRWNEHVTKKRARTNNWFYTLEGERDRTRESDMKGKIVGMEVKST
jgi:hypothetical protein